MAAVAVVLGAYSIWHGNRTIRKAEEVRQLAEKARVDQSKPHLGFVPGKGELEILPGKSLMKVTPLYYRKDSLSGAEGVGMVRNYGAGPGLP